VDVETSSSIAKRVAHDEKTTLRNEKSSESQTTESNQSAPSGPEPGAVPNTGKANEGLSLAQGQSGPSSVSEKTRVETEMYPGTTTEEITKPAGRPTVLSAAVRIPRSYFVRKYKVSNPSSKEPDDAALQPLVEAATPTYRRIVQNCTDIKTDEAVSIDVYDDFDAVALGVADPSVKSAGLGAMVSSHGKELVLGVLAVISLFMVSMIVKKGPQAPVIAAPEAPRETPNLAASEALAGIVGGEVNATLDGMELDDDTLRAQQVVHQVSTMVKEDPDAAATLVKRWLNRS
jgi:flagellar biosynthesis/type III secretory pathway M-ring protein FliF/YscJ